MQLTSDTSSDGLRSTAAVASAAGGTRVWSATSCSCSTLCADICIPFIKVWISAGYSALFWYLGQQLHKKTHPRRDGSSQSASLRQLPVPVNTPRSFSGAVVCVMQLSVYHTAEMLADSYHKPPFGKLVRLQVYFAARPNLHC